MNPESQQPPEDHPSRPAEPLVERNAFRDSAGARAALPLYEQVRDRLPEPVLPADPALTALYDDMWRTVWQRFGRAAADSLTGPIYQATNRGPIDIGQSALAARLAGYAQRAFDCIHVLDNFYAAQLDDGFIPREMDAWTGGSCWLPFDPNSTGPNLLAWSEWRHYRLTGDADRLAQVFWPIMAYHRWLRRHRTWQSGLYWTTGYAAGHESQTCVPDGAYHHRHWTWLNATLEANLSALLLGRMAELLGETAHGEELAAERAHLGRQINALLWNEATEFYHHTDAEGKYSPTRSMAAYWSLLDRQLVPEDRRRLLVQALRDQHNGNDKPAEEPEATAPILGTPLTSYMALRGLQTAGAWPLAYDLARDYLRGVGHAIDADSDLAPVIILMVLEQVIGLSIDWPLRQVAWRNYLGDEDETGLRRIPLGEEGTAELLAAGGVLTVRTDAPFTLTYRDRSQEFQSAVPAGTSTFDLR